MEAVIKVLMHNGSEWILNHTLPEESKDPAAQAAAKQVVIKRMFLIDGAVEVFAEGSPGSDLSNSKMGLHITLMPLAIAMVFQAASTSGWHKIMEAYDKRVEEDIQDLINPPPDDPDDDEEEETEPARQTTSLPSGAPVPVAASE